MLSNNNWHKLHNFWENHIVNRVFVTFYAMALLVYVSDLEWAIKYSLVHHFSGDANLNFRRCIKPIS